MTSHKPELSSELINLYKSNGQNSIDHWGKDPLSDEYQKYRSELQEEVITIRGSPMINFNTCSYLGIHKMPKIIAQAKEALDSWGTGYAVTRPFSDTPQYSELESILSQIYDGKHIYVGQSVTMCHFGFMTAKIKSDDIIVLEATAHASIRYAADLCKAKGIKVVTLSNWSNDEKSAAPIILAIDTLLKTHKDATIYFCADGICSMRGICLNPDLVFKLTQLDSKRVVAYIDDAHGMSLDGNKGQGIFHTAYVDAYGPMPNNLVLIVSLNKAWGSWGGALVLPHREDYIQMMMSPTSLMFSTQLPPPVMGANVAIAKFHLNGEVVVLQKQLQSNIAYFKSKLIPLLEKPTSSSSSSSLPVPTIYPLSLLSDKSMHGKNSELAGKVPIFYLLVGDMDKLRQILKLLPSLEILIGAVIYPVVPKNNCGFRIAILANHTKEQIDKLVNSLIKAVSIVYGGKIASKL